MMADFPAAPVLEALKALVQKIGEMERFPGHRSNPAKENVEVTQEDLDQKNKLLDELRSDLLPSIKHELKALLEELDPPHNSSQCPNPNVEMTLDTLSKLDQAMQKSLQYINCAPLVPLKPTHAHDHHFKRCKAFRLWDLSIRMMWLKSHLHSLFWCYIRCPNLWKPRSSHSEDLKYRAPTPRDETARCLNYIDNTIRCSQATDFALFQLRWKSVAEAFDKSLASLASLTSPHQRNNTILKRRLVKQARLAVPVFKLLRTLFAKISNMTTQKLPFALDTELNSDTLHKLDEDPGVIIFACQVHVKCLEKRYKYNFATDTSRSLRDRNERLSRNVDSYVFLLALHIIPSSPNIDHSSLQNDFKAWLSEWQCLWQTAKDRLLAAMCVPEEED